MSRSGVTESDDSRRSELAHDGCAKLSARAGHENLHLPEAGEAGRNQPRPQ